MLIPDGSKCIEKLFGCSVKVEDQPKNLRVVNVDGQQEYVCPDCSDGYFWNSE